MCDDCYRTIVLPSRLTAIEAVDLAIKTLSQDSGQPTAKISVGGIAIFVKADSKSEHLALGHEYEKQKRRVGGTFPFSRPIGPYVSGLDLDVYISGIVYYSTDKNKHVEYTAATKDYERSINRRAIYE